MVNSIIINLKLILIITLVLCVIRFFYKKEKNTQKLDPVLLKNDFLNRTDSSIIQENLWNSIERLYIGDYYKGHRNELYRNDNLFLLKVNELINNYTEVLNFLITKYGIDKTKGLMNRNFVIDESTYQEIIDASQISINGRPNICRYYHIEKQEEQTLKTYNKKVLIFRVSSRIYPNIMSDSSMVYEKLSFRNNVLIDFKVSSNKR